MTNRQISKLLTHELNDPIFSAYFRTVNYTLKYETRTEEFNDGIDFFIFKNCSIDIRHFISCTEALDCLCKAITPDLAYLIKYKYSDLTLLRKKLIEDSKPYSKYRYLMFNLFWECLVNKINDVCKKDVLEYIKENFNNIECLLPLNSQTIKLISKSLKYINLELENKNITDKEAIMIIGYKKTQLAIKRESKGIFMCPFSGYASDPETSSRKCTNPHGRVCGSCRVAQEWEECYG